MTTGVMRGTDFNISGVTNLSYGLQLLVQYFAYEQRIMRQWSRKRSRVAQMVAW